MLTPTEIKQAENISKQTLNSISSHWGSNPLSSVINLFNNNCPFDDEDRKNIYRECIKKRLHNKIKKTDKRSIDEAKERYPELFEDDVKELEQMDLF